MRTRDRGAASDIALIVGVPLLIIALIGGVWGVSVLLAEPVGRGEAHKQKESANNRVFAQERFRQLSEEYDATLTRIDQAAAARGTSPEAETRFQGLQSYCTDVVARYNSAAASYRLQDFRDADLPDRLDATTCTKEPTP
ncbi:MAG TPA: hypothetical protein VFM55_19120 [Micromonosporaceae bacterium]|nr:hypothetical protein [Micromonosporaceae bacterium]